MSTIDRIVQITWFLTLTVGLPALTVVADTHWLARCAAFLVSGIFIGLAPSFTCFRAMGERT